ncbi:MAG: polysaccharide deacetylase family protein [Proteobacteria bacterium]|nr:polysaccharide deacetylase family protein [Pseudomonadota bacterium]
MYHSISDDTSDPWAVSKSNFVAQMDWIKNNDYTVISLSQAVSNLNKNEKYKKCVVLTFDDGYVDFLENALSVLTDYDFPATLFVLPGVAGGTSYWEPLALRKPLLDWSGLQEVLQHGCTIGSHGMRHSNLPKLGSAELAGELSDSKKILEDKLGLAVESFSYPWGMFTVREINAVKCAGYSCAVTVGSHWGNDHETDVFSLEREVMSCRDSMSDFAQKICGHRKVFQKGLDLFSEYVHRARQLHSKKR